MSLTGRVLPIGGVREVLDLDALRINSDAVAFVRAFVATGKPVAAICHGPWTRLEADTVRGRRLITVPC